MTATIPREALVPILLHEIAARDDESGKGGLTACALAIAAANVMSYDTAYRRISQLIAGEYTSKTGRSITQQIVSMAVADNLLTGLDRQDAWYRELADYLPDYVPPGPQVCEDCGATIEPGVKPIELFRRVEGSLPDRVWDSTKQKWVRRPGHAAANGRRFRSYALCRSCRAYALRDRALKGGSNGRGKTLHTRDRIAPRRGGRPRLLTDEELQAAHHLYLKTGLSRREIAKRLLESRGKGSQQGYEQALMYGWRKLGLKLRSTSAQIAISVHGQPVNWKPKEHKRCRAKTRAGKRCTQWVRSTDGNLAEDGLCWNHAENTREKKSTMSTVPTD